MIPVRQTVFTDEAKGIKGNCFCACLASLLDLEIDEVPEFDKMAPGEWQKPFIEFLFKRGFNFIGTLKFGDWLNELDVGLRGFVIVGGISPRCAERGHSVIYYHSEPYFDPHPSDAFLVEPKEVFLIEIQWP